MWEDDLQLESMRFCVTCFIIVEVMCVRTPCNWKVCVDVLLVLLLCKLCVRGHPATGKYALLCHLFCYCASYVCEDTLAATEKYVLLRYLFCYCASYVFEDTLQL